MYFSEKQLLYVFWFLLGLEMRAARYIPRNVSPNWSRILPFHRSLRLQEPLMEGKDIAILQNLLRRQSFVSSTLRATGRYDAATLQSVKSFQQRYKLSQQDGIFDPETGRKVLDELMSDGYSSTDIPHDCKFFIRVPLRKDRTIEVNATLHRCGASEQGEAAHGEVLHTFLLRARGGTKNGVMLNQLTSNGDTPTGLSSIDLNTEFKPQWRWKRSFGVYPVLRLVKGLKGNAAIGRDGVTGNDDTAESFLNDYRYGILVHSFEREEWVPSMPMPDSYGCMKVHPADQRKIIDILRNKLGVKMRNNTFGRLPYPHKPQGLISIEEVD